MTSRVIPFIPQALIRPPHMLDSVPTAWDGVELILADVMRRFKIFPGTALEFGVFCGYSTAALANFFNVVIGVDTFFGDEHSGFSGNRENFFEQSQRALKDYKNVQLVRMDYREWIAMEQPVEKYDACHIDIVHHYKETNECVAWAVQHSDVVLVHDTIAFSEVRRAVQDVCWETGRVFYEYQVKHGLGILVKE